MIGNKILAFVALSGLVASTLAAPATLEKRSGGFVVDLKYGYSSEQVGKEVRSGGFVVDLKYGYSSEQVGKEVRSGGAIEVTTTENGQTVYSNTQHIQYDQQFPSKTCFDDDNYCVQITTTDRSCGFVFWARNQEFSYSPVDAKISGDSDEGNYSFSCEMNWVSN